MRRLESYDSIKDSIAHNTLVVVYFTGKACGACEVIKHKVEGILEKYPHVKALEVNGEESVELAAKFQVYALPLMLLFIEGKESIRVGRNINLQDFEDKIERYSRLLQ